MGKVPREQAEAEVRKWLERKKVFEETLENNMDKFDAIVAAVMNGVLTIDEETNEITQRLLFGEDVGLTEIKYRARLNDNMMEPHLRGVAQDDVNGRFTAMIAAITSQSKAVIKKMDSRDKNIASCIAFFFAG